MTLRFYTLAALAVTASAVAGLWAGALIATSGTEELDTRPPIAVVADVTEDPGPARP